MSRSIDLFIDAPLELPELAALLGQLTGTPLVPSSRGDHFVFTEGDAVALLDTHPFVDDGELLLSRYPYVLTSRVAGDHPPAASRELALLRHVAELIRQRTSMGVLLVHDLQNRDSGAPPGSVPGAAPPTDPGPVESAGVMPQ